MVKSKILNNILSICKYINKFQKTKTGITNNSIIFNSLSPTIIDDNNFAYIEALDYAFCNDEIKNIAISGCYGAGKTTVWNSYKKYKLKNKNTEFENVITVSLGNYTGNTNAENDRINNEERIERQIINQIIAQIDPNKIPLSKYKLKININVYTLIKNILMSLILLLSVLNYYFQDFLLSMFNNKIMEIVNKYSIRGIIFLIPFAYFLYLFFRNNKIEISKINLKGTEAKFNEENFDETIFDRDLREIIYLLHSSNSSIIVFEDLDRFENIEIFTKLKELNYILNSSMDITGRKNIVKFIYMIKDGLFLSKNRTKFFDFIIPIIPIVDSKTSDNTLINLFNENDFKPDINTIMKVSLYIDDMRVLKNIVNEYNIYSEIIPHKEIGLESNKLFAIITLKNIIPKEFEYLKDDKGYIKNIYKELETKRNEMYEQLKSKLLQINESIHELKFESLALKIPPKYSIRNELYNSWAELLKSWSNSPTSKYSFLSINSYYDWDYNEFLEEVIYNKRNEAKVDNPFNEIKENEINNLLKEKKENENTLRSLKIFSYKEILHCMTFEEKDKLFNKLKYDNLKENEISLIRYLIVEGLIDETYWYYTGNFDTKNLNSFKINDIKFMKGLIEQKELDLFLNIETPERIIENLTLDDFYRSNILNKIILETCILSESYVNKFKTIMFSVENSNNYEKLIIILNNLSEEIIFKLVDILIVDNIMILEKILKNCVKKDYKILLMILNRIFIQKDITINSLEIFKDYVENNELIIETIQVEQWEIFNLNIQKANIKFKNLINSKADRYRIKCLENLKAYKLTVDNIQFICSIVKEENVNCNSLLKYIYTDKNLSSTQKYIDENFEEFICDYIDKDTVKIVNIEELLIRVLNSNIDDDYKLRYITKNDVVLSDLNLLNENLVSNSLIELLFALNLVEFNASNLKYYSENIDYLSENFIKYINLHFPKNIEEQFLSENILMCNKLINNPQINDEVFNNIIPFVNNKILKLNESLTNKRVSSLIKFKLIDISESNINVLLLNKYYEEIIKLIESNTTEKQEKIISILIVNNIEENLIYKLLNSSISFEVARPLFTKIDDKIKIKEIDNKREEIIEYITINYLTDENIKCICSNFKEFPFKLLFIRRLIEQNKIYTIDYECLNENVLNFICESTEVETRTKVSLILIKIQHNCPETEIRRYLLKVEEISNLAKVWEHKHPPLDNEYSKLVGEELVKYNYVKSFNYNGVKKIKL